MVKTPPKPNLKSRYEICIMRICLDQLGERARGRVFDMSEIHDGPSSATSFLQSGHAYCSRGLLTDLAKQAHMSRTGSLWYLASGCEDT